MKTIGLSAVAAALFGGAMLLFAPAPGSATALASFAVAAPGETVTTEQVHYRRSHRSRRHSRRHDRPRYSRHYDRHRHGRRYRHRRPGFRYHYGGYYYANPWWIAPGIGIGVTVPVYPAPRLYLPSAHVSWCQNRYRTYDHRTDTYVPRIGVRARCISPYR